MTRHRLCEDEGGHDRRLVLPLLGGRAVATPAESETSSAAGVCFGAGAVDAAAAAARVARFMA